MSLMSAREMTVKITQEAFEAFYKEWVDTYNGRTQVSATIWYPADPQYKYRLGTLNQGRML